MVNVVVYGPSGPVSVLSQAGIALLRDRSRAFSTLAGTSGSPGVNLASDRGSAYIRNLIVTAGYCCMLGGGSDALSRARTRTIRRPWCSATGSGPATSALTLTSSAPRCVSAAGCTPSSA